MERTNYYDPSKLPHVTDSKIYEAKYFHLTFAIVVAKGKEDNIMQLTMKQIQIKPSKFKQNFQQKGTINGIWKGFRKNRYSNI